MYIMLTYYERLILAKRKNNVEMGISKMPTYPTKTSPQKTTWLKLARK